MHQSLEHAQTRPPRASAVVRHSGTTPWECMFAQPCISPLEVVLSDSAAARSSACSKRVVLVLGSRMLSPRKVRLSILYKHIKPHTEIAELFLQC